jgi:ubiquinone/menaquinone biosynthesis C-methylase UbiE
MTANDHVPYVLGSDEAEMARLEQQARSLAAPTKALLQAAGIGEGMRVLDLGAGPGYVSLLLAELVGPIGEVVGIDADPRMLARAEERRAEAGVANVRYLDGDARTFHDPQPFDAIAERLFLFHLPDAVEVVRHHTRGLRPGGIFTAVDFDITAARTEPPTPIVTTLVGWMLGAFRSAGADPAIGTRLPRSCAPPA